MTGSIMLLAEDQPKPLGFSKMAHVGNMCDIDTLDVLSYYGEDNETEVIVLYMEGFNKGRALIDKVKEITSGKPVIVLKVGRNDLGAKAAYSHTGTLAGKDEIYDAAFKKSGITRVNGLRELIDSAKAFSMQPLPEGNRISILTEAGGPGTMAMDELGKYSQIKLASISEKRHRQLRQILPPIAIICQPDGYIDMTAAAMEKHHREALEIVLEEDNVDGVILISVPPTFLPPMDLAREIIDTITKSKKPVLTCLLAGKWVYEARKLLEENSIPTFDTPEQAVKAMINMINRKKYLEVLDKRSASAK
jgi:acetyltransferase